LVFPKRRRVKIERSVFACISPIIYVKPYLPETDSFPDAKTPGWVYD